MKHCKRRTLAAVLLAVVFAFGTAAVSLADSVKVHDNGDAYLFNQSGGVIGSAKAGGVYELLEENGQWYKIRLEDGTEGWIATDRAEIIDDAPEGSVTINRLLRGGLPNEKIAVDDDLSAYSPANSMFHELTKDFRIIILEREAPEKAFDSVTKYPPFEDGDGFPAGFTGTDIGSPKVWLRGDLMNRIPAQMRATSLQNATYLVIIENYYEHGGTISVTDYKSGNDDDIPVFETVEEMTEYFSTHQKEVSSITYYPKFSALAFISVYDTETKDFSFFDYTYTPAMRFARNPEASDQWDSMYRLYELLYLLDETAGPDGAAAKASINTLEWVPQNKKDLWISCIDAGEYSTASHSIGETFWSMAEDLKILDSSEDNRKNYELLIRERNIDAFALFATRCEYSGFSRSIESIEESKDYIAAPDAAWTEKAIEETIALFN